MALLNTYPTIRARVGGALPTGIQPVSTILNWHSLGNQMRTYSLPSYLVTPKQLANALFESIAEKNSRLVPMSAAWFLPNDSRTGFESFKENRIPGSRFFDLDKIRDESSTLPHMLPRPDIFAEAMSSLGIKNSDTIVVYDTNELGIFSAPRAGWTLRVLGHPKVHVLNNFRVWCQEGLPTESGDPPAFEREDYREPLPGQLLDETATFDTVKTLVQDPHRVGKVSIVDARPRGRWLGEQPEPRPSLPSGHIPDSISLPFTELLDPETKTILPASELIKIFQTKSIDLNKPSIASCGTGTTAAIIHDALVEADGASNPQRRIYDGSWTEWAQRATLEEGLIRKGSR
ncbi:MAG: hypothetical protein M1831_005518 [Alyxoria varia]|nr:MAG: hypothetical protein M1831_005518 [Alyxoria varia]